MNKLTATMTIVVLNKSKYVKLSVRVGDKVYDEYCGYGHYRYNEIACESSMLTSIQCRATADGQLIKCGIDLPGGRTDSGEINWDLEFIYQVSKIIERSVYDNIAVPMVAIIKWPNGESSEHLGVVYGRDEEEFQKNLERKLARIKAKFPECEVFAKEA